MTDRLPPQFELWNWPAREEPARFTNRTPVPTPPVRIGDAERDKAVSALGEHFAAGRLDREEFDTRVDQAMAATYDRDLRPLFADLPRAQLQPVQAPAYTTGPGMRTALPLMLLWWLPFLLVGAVVAAVLIGAPWLLWGFIWVAVLMSFMGRRHRYPHHGYRHHR